MFPRSGDREIANDSVGDRYPIIQSMDSRRAVDAHTKRTHKPWQPVHATTIETAPNMADKDSNERVDIFPSKGKMKKKSAGGYGQKSGGVSKKSKSKSLEPLSPTHPQSKHSSEHFEGFSYVLPSDIKSMLAPDPVPEDVHVIRNKGGKYTTSAPSVPTTTRTPDSGIRSEEYRPTYKSDRQYKSAASTPIFVLNEVRGRNVQAEDAERARTKPTVPIRRKPEGNFGKEREVRYGE